MKPSRTLLFALISGLAGLAAALLVVSLFEGTAGTGLARHLGSGPVSYADAVARATPSVVNIFSSKVTLERGKGLFDDPLFQRFFGDRLSSQPRKRRQTNLGSGVIIDGRGFILTNHHVIEGAEAIRVVLSDGRTLDARVAGTDPDTDLAVIKVETDRLPAITVGDSRHLRVGDVVLAIGNPFGVGQTVTMGIVSATGRSRLGINTFENFIQTDAAINPGNSGGALINARGELVGINTAIFSQNGGSDGIGFAIPVALAKGVMDQILRQGRVVRGWLGIAGQDITPQLAEAIGAEAGRGVLVSAVLEGGPADRAGVEPGDIITHIDNRVPGGAHDILEIISRMPPGSSIELRGWRDGEPLRLTVEVAERPQIRDR